MTPTLRKYHRYTWFFLAGFMPLLFVAAIAVIPQEQPVLEMANYQPVALTEILGKAFSEHYAIALRGDADTGGQQLEIEVLTPLTNPATLVYLVENEMTRPEDGILIGGLGSQNIYRFDTREYISTNRFVLFFDPIKNIQIEFLKI
ncbi:MAG: hypothetical protein R2825_23190 [Saprospiraceae bacterium]